MFHPNTLLSTGYACTTAKVIDELLEDLRGQWDASVPTFDTFQSKRQVPLLMAEQGTHTTVCTALGLPGADSLDLREWKTQIADRWDRICADPVRRPSN